MNRSGRSWQVSDCERFPQVAHDKWANEQIACFFRVNRSFTHLLTKTSDSLIFFKLKSYFLVYFLYFFSRKNKWFTHSLFFNERCERITQVAYKNKRCEQIAQVAHHKWATMSDLLRSLTKNEWMSESLIFRKNEQFAQKTDERSPIPAEYR